MLLKRLMWHTGVTGGRLLVVWGRGAWVSEGMVWWVSEGMVWWEVRAGGGGVYFCCLNSVW